MVGDRSVIHYVLAGRTARSQSNMKKAIGLRVTALRHDPGRLRRGYGSCIPERQAGGSSFIIHPISHLHYIPLSCLSYSLSPDILQWPHAWA